MPVQVPERAEEACQIYDPTTKLIILRRSPKTYKYKKKLHYSLVQRKEQGILHSTSINSTHREVAIYSKA